MGRYQDQWHEELDKITISLDRLALDNAEEGRSAILDRLKRPTDIFLRKKRWFFCSTTHEDRLNALIRGHSNKSIALLSCAHALPRPTIRSLLATPNELNVDLTSDSSASRYVGLIATIHCINDKAVSKDEAQRARALILLLERKSSTFLRHLRSFFQVPDPNLLYDLFPPGSLDTLLDRLCLSFAAQLEGFRHRCDWAAAYEAIGELSKTFGISPKLDGLINVRLVYVRAWTHWRPVQHRILGQENLSLKHKSELRDLLVLNGPDFTRAGQRTALDALLCQARRQRMDHICNGRFFVWLSTDPRIDSRTYLDGIFRFPSGSRLSMHGAIKVFVFLCIRNQVSLRTLRILEEAAALKKPFIYKSLAEIFYSSTSSVRTNATMHLLKTVHTSGNHTVVDCLNGYIKDIIQEDLKDIQMRLHDLMDNGTHRNPYSVAVQVQGLGQSIADIPSLRMALDHHSQLLLNAWPSAQEVDALFQLRAELASGKLGPALETELDRYCLVRLTGRGIVHEDSRASLVALLWHWQERPHVPRQTLALSIMSCPSLPLPLKTESLLFIRDMQDDHLRELDAIICSGTEMACTHLAKLICSGRFFRQHERGCWKDILLSMMEGRKDTLLEHTVAHMDMKTWFKWLGHLRNIFDITEGSADHGQPVLRHELHSWSQVLESRYLEVLTRLEDKPNMSVLVQACVKDWQHQASIRRILDFFLMNMDLDPRHPMLLATDELSDEGGDLYARAWGRLAALI